MRGGYPARYKAETGNAEQHATGGTEYCDSKLHDGSIATTQNFSQTNA